MNARTLLLALAASVAAAWSGGASPARAQEPNKAPTPFVVVVGVGQFDDKAIDPRPTADADAKALYDLLTDPKYLGVPADRAKLLLSAPDAQRKGQKATRDAIVSAVNDAVANTGKDDTIVLAFFGRGASANDKTCFFTPDTVLKERGKTGLVFGTDLEPAFKKLKSQKVLILHDVHYKGFKPGDEKIAEPNLRDLEGLLFGPEDAEDSTRPQDRLMILSGFISADPLAKGDRGLFALTVADALQGKADAAPYNDGYEPDGLVTIDELVKYLDREIPNRAREIGKTDKDKESQAIPIGAGTSHFVVTKNPAESAKVRKRIDAVKALAKAGDLPAELAKEGEAILYRMPKLKATQQLRKDYQKLADDPKEYPVAKLTADRDAIKKSMKLAKKDAENYADNVQETVNRVKSYYIRDLNAGDLTAAAIRGLYRRVEEPLPTEIEEKLKTAKKLTEDERLDLLVDARLRLGKREDLDEPKDTDLSLLMMMASLNDPYSVYFDAEAVRRTASSLRGRFPGVGIQIRRDAVHDALLIVTPIKGSPAFEAGIRAGDLIVEIRREVTSEGEPLPADAQKVYSTKGMKTEDAIKVITGKPGTPITLVIQRGDEKETRVFSLKRRSITVETVLGVKRDDKANWSFWLDEENKIGYIHLTQFVYVPDGTADGGGTYADLKKAVKELKAGGMKGLVLDLRGNPGGFLISATKICGLFVGREKVVSVKPRAGSRAGGVRNYSGEERGETGFPMVVLVNGNSASASEIVGACLQDHNRAVIAGEKSYGKGSVQDILRVDPTGGEIKLTIARYYPPSDRNIDKLAADADPAIKEWGVSPDKGYEVKLSREEQSDLADHLRDLEVIRGEGAKPKDAKKFEDKQLDRAVKYLKEEAKPGKAGR
ncbi:MAG: S41 family peptidase [Gemmataceae bacterium]|nr:S41 family peptidase [Gemmataceae bacterium]